MATGKKHVCSDADVKVQFLNRKRKLASDGRGSSGDLWGPSTPVNILFFRVPHSAAENTLFKTFQPFFPDRLEPHVQLLAQPKHTPTLADFTLHQLLTGNIKDYRICLVSRPDSQQQPPPFNQTGIKMDPRRPHHTHHSSRKLVLPLHVSSPHFHL